MGPFIPVELRPVPGGPPDRSPPVAPQASKAEVRRRARDVLGDRLAPGAGDGPGAADVGRDPAVAWVVLGGESVLLHVDTGVYYTLNRVATVVWDLLAGGRPLAAVAAALCDRFAIDARTARADLAALVADLRRAGLVTPCETSDGPVGS
jgi:hypothetical protein